VSAAGPLRAVLADDEPPALATLRLLLAGDPEIEVVAECTTGPEAAEAIRREAPDLVLLDVQMPGATGLEVAEALSRVDGPRIIFVTAHAQHALRAFDAEAVDYLLKPFDDERFERALARAKTAVRERQALGLARQLGSLGAADPARPGPPGPQLALAQPPEPLTRLAVRDGGAVHLVAVEAIDWIGAQDYYAELHAGGRSWLLRESLRSLEARLDPRRFVRIHRAAIVNLDRIRTLEPASHGDLLAVLSDGSHLRVSRSHRHGLDALLGGGR
jgi:two-component system LytT family response regulator